MKKRLLALLLSVALAFTVCACGDGKEENTESTQAEQTEQAEQPYVISLPDHDDLSVMLTGDYEITETRILEYYYMIIYNAGEGLVEVTDRDTVQEGDIVKIDYTGYLDGEAFEGGSTISEDGTSNPQIIDVSNNCSVDTSDGSAGSSFIDGFSDGLIGAKKGETVKHNVTFPESYGSETLAGKETTFEFTVHEIYTERTPETLTDEFVAEHFKNSYDVSTVDELMAFIKEDLTYVYVMNFLIYNSVVEIPESYLNTRLDEYMDYYIENYAGGQENFEAILSAYGYTESYIRVQLAEELEAKITEEIVLAELVEQDKLELDEKANADYVASIIAANSSAFPDEEAIYKYTGLGDAEAGKAYLMNQRAARTSILEKVRAMEE